MREFGQAHVLANDYLDRKGIPNASSVAAFCRESAEERAQREDEELASLASAQELADLERRGVLDDPDVW